MKPLTSSIENQEQSGTKAVSKIILPYAFIGGIIVILYFLVMRFAGFYQSTGLRAINYLLMAPVIYFAIKAYITKGVNRSYLLGIYSGILTYFIAYGLLSIFMLLYLSFADPQMMTYIHDASFPELQLNPLSVAGLLMGEGMVAGVITSYLLMQNFKDDIRKAA